MKERGSASLPWLAFAPSSGDGWNGFIAVRSFALPEVRLRSGRRRGWDEAGLGVLFGAADPVLPVAPDKPDRRGDNNHSDYCVELVQIYIKAGERLAASPNYRRVRFEDIQANPRKMLEQLAHFCGLHFTTRQLGNAAATIRPERVRSTSA